MNDLRPDDRRASGFKCSFILRAAHQVFSVRSSNRKALELQSRKPIVQVIEERWHGGEQLLASGQIGTSQPALGPLR